MFTWVCPTCGKELDLSIKECPECRERAALADAAPPPAAGLEPQPSSGVRFWLMLGLLAVAGILVIIAIVHYRTAKPAPETAPKVALDRPAGQPSIEATPTAVQPGSEGAAPAEAAPASAAGGVAPPAVASADDIEVAGIRMSYDAQNRPQVRALVINHGEEGLRGATLTVTLRPASSAPDAPPLGRFTVRLPGEIKPGESREVRAPLDALATLAAMPRWHNLRADVSLH
jgi:hypothetical protein